MTARRRIAARVVLVINGEDVPLLCARAETIADIRQAALHTSRNLGRPEEDWEMRTSAGRLLDPSSLVGDLPDVERFSPLVFLSLKVGCGGAVASVVRP